MRFTGEQIIPDDLENKYLFLEHLARYMYAAQFVPGKRVLDLGCGTGYGANYLAANKADLVIGVDINQEAITYARSHYQAANLIYLRHDCLKIGLSRAAVDVVVSFEVIEHIEDWQTYLAEIKRVLKPGGYLIGSTPNKKLHSADVEISPNPFHVREYFLTGLRQALSTCFAQVWVLGQSPLQGFVISETQSLSHLVEHNAFIPAELIVDPKTSLESVENAKDFVFICQNEAAASPATNGQAMPYRRQGLYVSEHSAVELMTTIQTAKSLHEELNRVTNRLTFLDNKIKAYERGRFMRFMRWIHQTRRHLRRNFRRTN